MKSYDETIRSVFDRMTEYENNKKRQRKILIPLCCGFVVALLGVGLWWGMPSGTPPIAVVTKTTANTDKTTTKTNQTATTNTTATTATNTTATKKTVKKGTTAKTMPTNPTGIGGPEGDTDYFMGYHPFFTNGIEEAVFNKKWVSKDDFYKWSNQFEHAKMGGTRNKNEHNYYEFIQEFSISREQTEELCAWYKECFPESDLFTDEQVEVLYTKSREEVYRYFANPHAVLVGIDAYPPRWLAQHTAEEYRKVGITYTLLSQKLDDVLAVADLTKQQREHILAQCEALKK